MSGILATNLRYMKCGDLIGEIYLMFGSVYESLAVLKPCQLEAKKTIFFSTISKTDKRIRLDGKISKQNRRLIEEI